MPENANVWFVSEQTGFAQLYEVPFAGGTPKALTDGKWEIEDLRISDDKKSFYLTTSEGVHAQPDVWMLLPALAALHLRRRQTVALARADLPPCRAAAWGALEGVCWGAGCLVTGARNHPGACG